MPVCRPYRLLSALFFTPVLLSASVVFDFESVPADTSTPFTYTVNGVTATFSSSCSFWVEPYAGFSGSPLSSGNDLTNFQDASPCALDIAFSEPATGISLNYGYDFGSNPFLPSLYLTFIEYSGGLSGSQVATQTGHGVKAGATYATGALSFSGTLDAIRIQNPMTVADFAIDDITYYSASTPEPWTACLTILGLAGALALRRLAS